MTFAPRLAFALLCLLLPAAAQAGETPFVRTQGAEVRLLSGGIDGGTLEAGIEIRLAAGWKTYWRYPGDSGIPPRFDWSGSRNVRAAAVDFPAPRRFSDGASGFSIGYKGGSVILPVRVELDAADKPTRLDLTLDFAVCEALCVPAQAQLSLDVAPGGAKPNPALAAARALLPSPAPVGGAAPAVASFSVDSKATPPVLEVIASTTGEKADLFVEGPTDAWALPLPSRAPDSSGRTRFTLALDGLPSGATWQGAQLNLTLVDGPRAVATVLTLPKD
ncbi:protein-disulfide reductase DsbD domain-containing protein [Aquabacter cavernae]|uniref:protein-disulfide reductase DsbD domain-containing protein n=1 Tax=Aquabacter cavernae TaxID=2496029 RepID=UPI000F8C5104|nr:protein-disulfide reductase DsbD domain-containing protein [Aquabacter cavernae]